MEKFLSQTSSAFNNQYKLGERIGRAYEVELNSKQEQVLCDYFQQKQLMTRGLRP